MRTLISVKSVVDVWFGPKFCNIIESFYNRTTSLVALPMVPPRVITPTERLNKVVAFLHYYSFRQQKG